MKILLIEDNDTIIKGLKYSFANNNYDLEYKKSIEDAKKYLNENNNIDLIILDVTLPDGNGFDLFINVINSKNIPTIFLTAIDEEEFIVNSLNMGAEDYLTKPFSTNELLARVNKILKRSNKNIISIKDITFDVNKMEVYKKNKLIELTSLEIQLLSMLLFNINRVVTRNAILDRIWEITGNDVDNHTITVYFNRIREKLDTNIIKTVKGIGYRIDEK